MEDDDDDYTYESYTPPDSPPEWEVDPPEREVQKVHAQRSS